MSSKRPEVNEFAAAFADFYHSTVENFKQEAFNFGKCDRIVYSYGDQNDLTNSLKAHEIPFSTKAKEIILFLQTQIEINHSKNLNGEIDDEWSELAAVFSECRLRFLKHEKINFGLKKKFLEITNKLFDEWEEKSN